MIDFANVREVGLADHNLVATFLFLYSLEDVQPAAPAIAFDRVGAVGYLLKLAQDKLRDNQDSREKPGFSDIGYAAINDDRRVEYE